MSPKEFCALTRSYQDQEERMDRRFATMQAFYAQCNGLKLTTEDFMSSNKPVYPTDEQLERDLTAMFGVGPKKAKQ